MFTALMSLGMVVLVVVTGIEYSHRMDELFSGLAEGRTPRN
jgi:hypothetical protein